MSSNNGQKEGRTCMVGLYCKTQNTQSMEALMVQCIRTVAFLKRLFDREEMADKAARIVEGILAARSPRLSAIAQHMPGNPCG